MNLFNTSALAEATATTAAGGDMLSMIIMIVAMVAVFYFLLIRPQKKREQEVQKMREAIEVGDEVVTIGGIVGRVVSIKEDTLVVETSAERSKLRLARWAIQQNNTAVERANEARKAAAKEAKNAQ